MSALGHWHDVQPTGILKVVSSKKDRSANTEHPCASFFNTVPRAGSRVRLHATQHIGSEDK